MSYWYLGNYRSDRLICKVLISGEEYWDECDCGFCRFLQDAVSAGRADEMKAREKADIFRQSVEKGIMQEAELFGYGCVKYPNEPSQEHGLMDWRGSTRFDGRPCIVQVGKNRHEPNRLDIFWDPADEMHSDIHGHAVSCDGIHIHYWRESKSYGGKVKIDVLKHPGPTDYLVETYLH